MTYAQPARMAAAMAPRAHPGSGEGNSCTRPPSETHAGATSPPSRKAIPAAAASGLAANESPSRPFRSASAEWVVPQVGQGTPVMARNGQAGTNGASASQ